jgi:hypothetical protein
MTDDPAPKPSVTHVDKKPEKGRLKNGRLSARERRRRCRRSASYSTGPRTKRGKYMSSKNACRHCFRIENFISFTEKFPEVKGPYQEWIDFYKPASPGEWEQCQTAAMCSVQKRRLFGTQTTKINKRIRNARILYDQEQKDRLDRDRTELLASPALAVKDLKRFALGCRWLLQRYQRLADLLERDGTLSGNDRDELIRLKGCEPYLDKLIHSEFAYLVWLYCILTKPEVSDEELQVLGAPEVMPLAIRAQPNRAFLPPVSMCRELLRKEIDTEIALLTRREFVLRKNIEIPERDDAEQESAELAEKDGVLFARYFQMFDRAWHRAYNALVKGREQAARTGRIPGAPIEAFEDPAQGASANGQGASSPAEEAVLTSEITPEAAAEERTAVAAELAPGERNGIGAAVLDGDGIVRDVLDSQWWIEPSDGEELDESVNGRPPEPWRRE